MMNISYFAYDLEPNQTLGQIAKSHLRQGALLKVEWVQEGLVGYSDLFPWPELNDQSLEKELHLLKARQPSELGKRSLYYARLDAEARIQKISLMKNLRSFENHFLITDLTRLTSENFFEALKLGFTRFKIKMSQNYGEELKNFVKLKDIFLQNENLKLRIDFNSQLSSELYEDFLQKLDPFFINKIEFIEDPMPWSWDLWEKHSHSIPLALDNEINKLNLEELRQQKKINSIGSAKESRFPFQVLVIKPVRNSPDSLIRFCQDHEIFWVITSYLDHPIGVRAAIYEASRFCNNPLQLISGCLSMNHYKPSLFYVHSQGPVFKETVGANTFGWGDEEVFRNLDWRMLL